MLSLPACFACAASLPAPDDDTSVERVLAVDISQSMDDEEFALRRAGYVEALRYRGSINAVLPRQRLSDPYFPELDR